MAFLMLGILIIFLCVAYARGKGDLISPYFLYCLALFVSFCVVLLNFQNWEIKISPTFVLYITTAMVFWGIGSLIVKSKKSNLSTPKGEEINIPLKFFRINMRYPALLFALISVVFSVLFLIRIYKDAGPLASITDLPRVTYDNIVYNSYSPGFLYNQMFVCLMAISYINIFRLLVRIYNKYDKMSVILLLIPIIMYLIVIMVWSDRNILLRFAFFSICIFVFFFKENYKKKNVNTRIVLVVAILLISAILVFYLFGKVKSYKSNIVRALGIYGGSGLYNFNLWLETFDGNLQYGLSTFGTFIRIIDDLLERIGYDLTTHTADRFSEYIIFEAKNGYVYSSNIYSAFRPYVEDFGYFGVMIYPLILGMLFQWLYNNAKVHKYNFSWILYCMLLYPIIFTPILEQLFNRFTVSYIYELAWPMLVYYGVYGIHRKQRVILINRSGERLVQ